MEKSKLPDRIDAGRKTLRIAVKTSETKLQELERGIRALKGTVHGKPSAAQCMHMKHLWQEYEAELSQLRETRTLDLQLGQVQLVLRSSTRVITVTALKQETSNLLKKMNLTKAVQALQRIEKQFAKGSNALSALSQHSNQAMIEEADRNAVREEMGMSAVSAMDVGSHDAEVNEDDAMALFDLSRLGGVERLREEVGAQYAAHGLRQDEDDGEEKVRARSGPGLGPLSLLPSVPTTAPASRGGDDDDQHSPASLLLANEFHGDDAVVSASTLLEDDQ